MAKTVKRIKLSGGKRIVEDDPSPKPNVITASEESEPKNTSENVVVRMLLSPFRYVANSWKELKQVRWPNRRASWVLTLAVILFTAFFSIVILILDALFQILFKEVLLK